MQIQYINEMLNIPELQINQILSISADEIQIEAVPVGSKQGCPICRSDETVSLKGSNGLRTVRHLPAFEKKVVSGSKYPNALLAMRGWLCLDV